MKLSTFLAPLLLALGVSAGSGVWSSGTSTQDDDSLGVPGKNPLKYCEDPADDILTVKNVDLDPNPPSAGTNLTVTAVGVLNEDVKSGAQIKVQVKYGLITIIRQTFDLCTTVGNVDLECPLKKGDIEISKEISLPKQIPPGKYTVLADVETEDEEKITCLTATIEFHSGKGVFSSWKEDI